MVKYITHSVSLGLLVFASALILTTPFSTHAATKLACPSPKKPYTTLPKAKISSITFDCIEEGRRSKCEANISAGKASVTRTRVLLSANLNKPEEVQDLENTVNGFRALCKNITLDETQIVPGSEGRKVGFPVVVMWDEPINVTDTEAFFCYAEPVLKAALLCQNYSDNTTNNCKAEFARYTSRSGNKKEVLRWCDDAIQKGIRNSMPKALEKVASGDARSIPNIKTAEAIEESLKKEGEGKYNPYGEDSKDYNDAFEDPDSENLNNDSHKEGAQALEKTVDRGGTIGRVPAVSDAQVAAAQKCGTLSCFYDKTGQQFQTYKQRQDQWEALGLGKREDYNGTAAQNRDMLEAYKSPSGTVAPPINSNDRRALTKSNEQQANARNLSEWYAAQGKTLAPKSERAKLYEQLGLGKASEFSGTGKQNQTLLEKLQGNANAPEAIQSAPAPGSGPQGIQQSQVYNSKYSELSSKTQSATSLGRFFSSLDSGRNVPSISARASAYKKFGLGDNYSGTAAQNTRLLNSIKSQCRWDATRRGLVCSY